MSDDAILAELRKISDKLTSVLDAVARAESEVPEYMRRFVMYYHDIIHIREAHVQLGLDVPDHINHEIERVSDRMKQLVDMEHNQGGTFHRVMEDMKKIGGMKYKHGRDRT
jgi:hypothetical protein